METITIEDQIRKAQKYHEAGQLNKACIMYASVLDVMPDHADALHLHGLIAYQEGKNEIGIDLI